MPRIAIPLYCFLLLTLPGGAGCQQGRDAAPGVDKPAIPFFDLKEYFTAEIDRLQKQQPRVRKTVRVDGQPETQERNTLNYEDELRIFLESDINRASWWDKYAIDSSYTDNGLGEVRYEATEKKLRVREVRIKLDNGEVDQISIIRDTQSPTFGAYQELVYQPDSGYEVLTREHVAFSKKKELRITVVFLP